MILTVEILRIVIFTNCNVFNHLGELRGILKKNGTVWIAEQVSSLKLEPFRAGSIQQGRLLRHLNLAQIFSLSLRQRLISVPFNGGI